MSEKRFYLDEEDRLCIHYDGRILASVGFQETEAQKIVDVLNEQAETIRKQSIRIYCQDKEVQRLLGQLEKIPKSIREVWLED